MVRRAKYDGHYHHARDFVKYVCRVTGVKFQDLRSRRKPFALMTLRGCLYAYLWYHTELTSNEIGEIMNRTHSTVITEGQKYYFHVLQKTTQSDEKINYIKQTYVGILQHYDAYNVQSERRVGTLASGARSVDRV